LPAQPQFSKGYIYGSACNVFLAVLPCLLSYLMVETDEVRAVAVRALHAILKLCKAHDDDCITRLLSRITRGKSQAGIIADSSYAAHVSALLSARFYVAVFLLLLFIINAQL